MAKLPHGCWCPSSPRLVMPSPLHRWQWCSAFQWMVMTSILMGGDASTAFRMAASESKHFCWHQRLVWSSSVQRDGQQMAGSIATSASRPWLHKAKKKNQQKTHENLWDLVSLSFFLFHPFLKPLITGIGTYCLHWCGFSHTSHIWVKIYWWLSTLWDATLLPNPPCRGPIPSHSQAGPARLPFALCGSSCCPQLSHHKRLKIILILII